MVETLDVTQWPRYMFHPENDPERVETPEEEGELLDLDLGWRREPYSDLEKLARQSSQRQARRSKEVPLYQELTEPIETPPRKSAAQRKVERDKLSYERRKHRKKVQP